MWPMSRPLPFIGYYSKYPHVCMYIQSVRWLRPNPYHSIQCMRSTCCIIRYNVAYLCAGMKSSFGEVSKYCLERRRAPTLPSVALRGARVENCIRKHVTKHKIGLRPSSLYFNKSLSCNIAIFTSACHECKYYNAKRQWRTKNTNYEA